MKIQIMQLADKKIVNLTDKIQEDKAIEIIRSCPNLTSEQVIKETFEMVTAARKAEYNKNCIKGE